MVDDEDKKEDSFDKEDKFDAFTPEGEALGYISLPQARLLAMETARDSPGDYGASFQGTPMVFDAVEEKEDEDYYVVSLSFRPAGHFRGEPGLEQFFIEKEGRVAYRQVRELPRTSAIPAVAFPRVPVAIGVAVVAVVAVIGVVAALSGGDDGVASGNLPTVAPAPAVAAAPAPTATPAPLGGRIAFVSDSDLNREIYVMNPGRF